MPPRQPRRRRLSSALRHLLLAVACVFLATGCADGWFYRPGGPAVPDASTLGIAAEDLDFAAPDGPALHGWWLPARGEPLGTVVYCHGNKGNVGQHLTWVRWLPARGFNVLLFDYRGYGRSAGEPSRAGTIADAVAALDVALARDPDRVVVYGHSLGGAIGIRAAAERPAVRAVVAEGTFPSYRAVARAQVPLLGVLLQFLVSSGEDPEDVLDRIPPRPLLVVHGSEDGIVPLYLGEALFERAQEPKTLYVAEGSGHRSPLAREGAAFEQRLVDFFTTALRGY